MNNEHTSYNMIIYYNDHNQYGGNFPDFARNLILQSLFSSIYRQNKKMNKKLCGLARLLRFYCRLNHRIDQEIFGII